MTETARDAHLILPAAAWGEANDTSINCNSRLLRLYEKFMDPPGEAKPDWEIFKWVGLRIAELYRAEGKAQEAAKFEFGKNWKTDEDVFLAGAAEFSDNAVSEEDEAKLEAENYKGVTYKFLKEVGQKGIQTPVRRDPKTGKLVGTVRRYVYKFGTEDGKFKWYGTDDWEATPPRWPSTWRGKGPGSTPSGSPPGGPRPSGRPPTTTATSPRRPWPCPYPTWR